MPVYEFWCSKGTITERFVKIGVLEIECPKANSSNDSLFFLMAATQTLSAVLQIQFFRQKVLRQSIPIWAAYAKLYLYGFTVRTGTCDFFTTRSATLPKSMCSRPFLP